MNEKGNRGKNKNRAAALAPRPLAVSKLTCINNAREPGNLHLGAPPAAAGFLYIPGQYELARARADAEEDGGRYLRSFGAISRAAAATPAHCACARI